MKPITVEICVEGLTSALEAAAGGADRIELCENLAVGGVTPSAGTIAVACRRLDLPVHVLIRPRGGDFTYSAPEIEAMRLDIEACKRLGCAAVVLGVLRPDGTVDEDQMANLIAEARPMTVTFHRAFDDVPDPLAALDTLIALGIDRVLTSGQARSARKGAPLLAQLVRRAAGRIAILAGGGVSREDLPILAKAGLLEVHAGSAACRDGRTDASAVRRLVEAARICQS